MFPSMLLPAEFFQFYVVMLGISFICLKIKFHGANTNIDDDKEKRGFVSSLLHWLRCKELGHFNIARLSQRNYF